MSFVTLAEAKAHLRVYGNDDDALIGIYIAAAEKSAVAIVDRGVYADDAAQEAAIDAAPGALADATVAYSAAITAAHELADACDKAAAIKAANASYIRAQVAFRRATDGIVADDIIKAATLLIIGHLYENREDVVAGQALSKLPNGAEWLLNAYKVYA